MLLYSTVNVTVQYCECYCTVLWMLLYSTVKVTVQYCECYCTVLWRLLYNTVKITVQYCEGYCRVLWRLLYSTVKVTVQYCEGYCTALWKLLYSTVKVTVQHCEGYCTVTFTVLTPYNAASQNRYQPHPVLPAQTSYAVIHGLCSPDDEHKGFSKHVETVINNKHLKLTINICLVASCWYSVFTLYKHFIYSFSVKHRWVIRKLGVWWNKICEDVNPRKSATLATLLFNVKQTLSV